MTETTPDTATTQGTVATLAGAAGERFGDSVAARYKSGDEWHELSFAAGQHRRRRDRARTRGPRHRAR